MYTTKLMGAGFLDLSRGGSLIFGEKKKVCWPCPGGRASRAGTREREATVWAMMLLPRLSPLSSILSPSPSTSLSPSGKASKHLRTEVLNPAQASKQASMLAG